MAFPISFMTQNNIDFGPLRRGQIKVVARRLHLLAASANRPFDIGGAFWWQAPSHRNLRALKRQIVRGVKVTDYV